MRLMATDGNQKKTSWGFFCFFLTLQRARKCWNVFIFLRKKHSPILSTPLGMMTSAYFLVWEEQNVFRNKCNVCLLNRIRCWTNKRIIGADHHTYRQTKLFKSWLHKCCILTENLLEISPSAHVSQNYRRRKKREKSRIWSNINCKNVTQHIKIRPKTESQRQVMMPSRTTGLSHICVLFISLSVISINITMVQNLWVILSFFIFC